MAAFCVAWLMESSCGLPAVAQESTFAEAAATVENTRASEASQAPLAADAIAKHGGIEYSSGPTWSMKLDLYRPLGPGPFPAVVMLHGGAWAWGSKFNWQFHARRLARRGFVVVAINYRKSPWHPFPAQWIDCRNAVRWVRAHAAELAIDPQAIGAYGYSAGGHLALLLLADCPLELERDIPENLRGVSPQVAAVVAGGSPCHFEWIDEDSYALWYWLRATRRSNPRIFALASPLAHCGPATAAPVFLYHGAFDRVVPLELSQRFHQCRLDMGLSSTLVVLPDCGHFGGFVNQEIVEKAADFLQAHLPTGKDQDGGKRAVPIQRQQR